VRRLLATLLFALSAVAPDLAGAQIIRTGRFSLGEPQLWLSGGAALQQGWNVVDGTTGSRWELSDAMQYGLGIDRTITGGTTAGLRASTSRVPLRYVPSADSGGGSREADVNVSQALAMLRVTSGRRFRTVLELGAGATVYSGFRQRVTGTALSPTARDTDFAFALGYGFGYSFTRAFQLDLVQDLATSLHQKEGLAAGEKRSARISSTRLTARFGLGN
jgi:opacity protein-like surface antigen